ncbi:DNA cytosine methyltransferase [Acinetobacter baumannii]|jgi:DNA (cytosine-5)-methyltransferase 1|uniref:Cytosine-specific methyltransferase n=3 Tax=Acinetobacter baumannii TaxID=470 RepID=A0A1S2FZE2_ACIBA|nr:MULTISPECIES: DNA cytosine methyltransferase [Acinetobacter]EHU2365107.1 DNA cytosine methyltransferase [Acinetobacter baumannii]EHU3230132.1 DNA cytosine methyltransferase [Acinetobacter baumannii]EHU3242392.1 DNA cytosine methyltransferase [Acinetobacter baumannii]EJA9989638.1 DNA cytosine methyltransferase [Acinetobacter baumannii]EJB8462295.1 DNA cytosine methyltransferase [Acinetobacter baumannii]
MQLKAIDLFAGAGGFTLAAHQAGVDVVAAIEWDKAAAETYRRNFIEEKAININLINNDINQVNLFELRKQLNLEVGELDLILGGPPCQGFSTHRIKDAGVDDPRNLLLLRYFEVVHEFRPKSFLVENVSGLLWERHADYLKKFLELAQAEGYEIQFCDILNAKDYGVPQNRKRVFIYGVRKDLNCSNIIFPPEPTHFAPTSGKTSIWRTASSVFEPIPNSIIKRYIEEYFVPKLKVSEEEAYKILSTLEFGTKLDKNDPCNIHMKPSENMIIRFMDTKLNGSREDAGEKHRLKCHSNGYKGHKDVYGRVIIHQPSNTITAGCNNPSKGRFVHPWLNHGITLRHAARLQSFPDDFIFYGNATDQAKQIGNAVPPLLGSILIKQICLNLKKTN